MLDSLAFLALPPNSGPLIGAIIGALVFGLVVILALQRVPANLRRPIVVGFTFIAGLFWVLKWLVPEPINRGPNDIPSGPVDAMGFWFQDNVTVVNDVANTTAAFLLGLGLFSLLRVHLGRAVKGKKGAFYSSVLLVCLVSMATLGFINWNQRTFNDPDNLLADEANWGPVQYAFDLLFGGLFQQMEAVMFSMIAFYILSAAYRAFRIRSVEATVLMGSALILMLSLMGAVDFAISGAINQASGGDPGSFLNNFKLTVIADWVKAYLQVPSLRALDFGVGLGALAMGLRLWLGLEKGGVS
jgi:hypothetical protein